MLLIISFVNKDEGNLPYRSLLDLIFPFESTNEFEFGYLKKFIGFAKERLYISYMYELSIICSFSSSL